MYNPLPRSRHSPDVGGRDGGEPGTRKHGHAVRQHPHTEPAADKAVGSREASKGKKCRGQEVWTGCAELGSEGREVVEGKQRPRVYVNRKGCLDLQTSPEVLDRTALLGASQPNSLAQ